MSESMETFAQRMQAEGHELWAAVHDLEALALPIQVDDPAWPLAQAALRITLLMRRSALSLTEALDMALHTTGNKPI